MQSTSQPASQDESIAAIEQVSEVRPIKTAMAQYSIYNFDDAAAAPRRRAGLLGQTRNDEG